MMPRMPRPQTELAFRASLLVLAALCALPACKSRHTVIRGLPAGVVEEDTRRLVRAQAIAAEASKTRDRTEAKRLYTEAVSVYRQLPAAWNNLGVLLMQDEQYLQAAEAFASASDLSPADPRPLYNIGLLWDTRGYLRDARAFYVRSLNRDASYLPALRGAIRADTLLNEGSDRTLSWLERALMLETDPQWQKWMRLQKIRIESRPLYRDRDSPDTGR